MEQPQNPGSTSPSPSTETGSTSSGSTGTGESSRLGRAKEFVGERYGAASDALKSGYGTVRDRVGQTYGQVREKVDDIDFAGVVDQGRAYVRSNPGKALLISIGVGFVIGLLLRRDDD